MLFNSFTYLCYFPIVIFVYYILKSPVMRKYELLIASYLFYMCWDAKYALLLFVSTLITFFSGILLGKIDNSDLLSKKKKKIIVAISFCANLFILFFFKYSNFAIEIINYISGGIFNVKEFDIVLPVGISFYTFQVLSYTVDVYRGDIDAEKDFAKYALFVSFFPQLLAGPIGKSKNLLKQLSLNNKFDYYSARDGFMLMLWGYFLKMVIADRISIYVDFVFGNIDKYPGMYQVVAIVLFAFQIYCDFAGYSTVAIGSAKVLGIRLMENFNAPYLALSVEDFWKRWHISLTSWFRDYLYIPLGGNRKGKIRKYCNKIVVFLISGLWHGASFTYIIWGGINGFFQILEEILLPFKKKVNRMLEISENSIVYKGLKILFTFCIVDFSWIFFRSKTIAEAFNVIKSIATTWNPWVLIDDSLYQCGMDRRNFSMMIISIVVLVLVDVCKYKCIEIRKIILDQDPIFRGAIVALCILFVIIFGIWGPTYEATSFVYFQF